MISNRLTGITVNYARKICNLLSYHSFLFARQIIEKLD